MTLGLAACSAPVPTTLRLSVDIAVLGDAPTAIHSAVLDEKGQEIDGLSPPKFEIASQHADFAPGPATVSCHITGPLRIAAQAHGLAAEIWVPCVQADDLRPADSPLRIVEGWAKPISGAWTALPPALDRRMFEYWAWTAADPAVATLDGTLVKAVGPGQTTVDGVLGPHRISVAVHVDQPLGPDQVVVLAREGQGSALQSIGPDGWITVLRNQGVPPFPSETDPDGFVLEYATETLWHGDLALLRIGPVKPGSPPPDTTDQVTGAHTAARLEAALGDRLSALETVLDGHVPIGLSASGRTLLVSKPGHGSAVVDLQGPLALLPLSRGSSARMAPVAFLHPENG